MTDAPEPWPALPPEATDPETEKVRRTAIANAEIDLAKARRIAPAAQAKQQDELNQKLAETLTGLTTGGVDRARKGAEFLQTAASAIAVLYTGMLTALKVADHPAPARSLVPMLFLGLAIAFATYYLGFVRPGKPLDRPNFANVPEEDLWVRLNYVSTWVRQITLARARALRAGVVSLFAGLFLLPIGLIDFPTTLIPTTTTASGGASGSTGTATTPTPKPTPTIAWPSPSPDLPNASLAAVLYAAQLEEFRKTLKADSADSSKTDEASRNNVAFWLTVAGLIAVILVLSLNTFDPGPTEPGKVIGPEIEPR
jgi:hypothetical protein